MAWDSECTGITRDSIGRSTAIHDVDCVPTRLPGSPCGCKNAVSIAPGQVEIPGTGVVDLAMR